MYDEYEAQFLHKAWQILQDISDQLAHNNQFAGSLRQHAERLKGDATQFAQGFPLRRYNVDLTKGTSTCHIILCAVFSASQLL